MKDSDTIDNDDVNGKDEIIMRMILKSKSMMMKKRPAAKFQDFKPTTTTYC